jgi:prepilin-type N-terminal cleavage/methylation domain-containing protein
MQSQRNTTPKKAFTLIEMLIVVTVIGILVGVATPNIIQAMHEQRIRDVRSNVGLIEAARDAYVMDNPTATTIDENSLKEYLRHNTLPTSPFPGSWVYEDIYAPAYFQVSGGDRIYSTLDQ